MNPYAIAWSMAAGACLILGLMHLGLWFMDRKRAEVLLFSIGAFAASTVAIHEQIGLTTEALSVYRAMDRWVPVSLAILLVSLLGFVQAYLGTGRKPLFYAISGLWLIALVLNFLSPQSLTYLEISDLKRLPTWLGREFTSPVAIPNYYRYVADLASLLILVFLVDATVRSWRQGDHRRALTVGGSSIFFILAAGVHTPLVDIGLIRTPYMVSFAFLAIVMAVSAELLRAAYLSSRLSRQVLAGETRWQALLKHVNLAVVSLDAEKRITLVNAFLARSLGYQAETMLGRSVAEFLPRSMAQEFHERFQVAAREGPRPVSRWPLLEATGGLRTFEWSTVRLTGETGAFGGLLAIGTDITERLQAQTDLARVRRDLDHLMRTNLLGELLAALAHELNQPLTAILSNAQAGRRFLEQPEPDLKELRTILDEIVGDDKRAGEVIHRLRSMVTKTPPARTLCDLNDALYEVERLVRSEMLASQVKLAFELAEPSAQVEVVKVDLQQVLMNLILNAAHAVRENPLADREIWVSNRVSKNEVRISVIDYGTGIPPERLSALFDPFATTRAGGMGMGLSICRRLVEQNHGRIEAANRAEGGAVFTVTLPTVNSDRGTSPADDDE